jgi:hypothetical protein
VPRVYQICDGRRSAAQVPVVIEGSVSQRCHKSFKTHRPNPCGRVWPAIDLCGLKSQVKQHVPAPSVGIPWTAVDPGKRVGSASGAEGSAVMATRTAPTSRGAGTCRSDHQFDHFLVPTINWETSLVISGDEITLLGRGSPSPGWPVRRVHPDRRLSVFLAAHDVGRKAR